MNLPLNFDRGELLDCACYWMFGAWRPWQYDGFALAESFEVDADGTISK